MITVSSSLIDLIHFLVSGVIVIVAVSSYRTSWLAGATVPPSPLTTAVTVYGCSSSGILSSFLSSANVTTTVLFAVTSPVK